MTDRCADGEPLHSAWLDGMLDADEQARLAAHLQGCEGCRRDVDSLARTRALLRNLPVRRLPGSDPAPVASSPRATRAHGSPASATAALGGRLRLRAAAGLVLALGLLGGAVFALGGQPAPDERRVSVPVDLFVADHLVHTVGGPVSTPVLVEGRQ